MPLQKQKTAPVFILFCRAHYSVYRFYAEKDSLRGVRIHHKKKKAEVRVLSFSLKFIFWYKRVVYVVRAHYIS